MYTAVVLSEEAHNKLVTTFGHLWDGQKGWKAFAHHLTMHMGPATENEQLMLGEFVTLVIDAVAQNEMVAAARVARAFTSRATVESKNPTPHITLAVNRKAGGKPVMSNQLTEWQPVETLRLRGRIEEVS